MIHLGIIGSASVGKSCLMVRYCTNEFKEQYVTFHDAMKKEYLSPNDNESYTIRIWDTAGLERYNTLTKAYYNNADGIILAYDVTDDTSFYKL